jgi:acyl-CoA synthetase (AMP-forming)/AMP-acid ligase II/pyrroloquinoline quinone (PQQ) biosynthesis protein C
MTELLEAIRSHERAGRSNPAFDDGHRSLSWGDTVQAIENTIGELEQSGLGRSPVGLDIDHSTGAAILLVALIEAGIPVVPLPPYFNEAQRLAALGRAGASACISGCSLDDLTVRFGAVPVEAAEADLPDSTAVISFSSGSTNEPKGVCLSADHLVAVATSVCDYLGRDLAGRHLPVLPFGILLEQVAGLFASLIAGGTYLPLPGSAVGLANPLRPDGKQLLDAVIRERATSLILVPEYLSALVAAMEARSILLPQLTLVAVGGASISPALLQRANRVGLPVRQGYGMTEAGSVITLEDGSAVSEGGVGRSIGSHKLWLADDGEIIIDGPLFLGLVGQFREPGSFATGDIGRFDQQGSLWIDGRKSNLIVTSFGRNISPEWLEGLLTAQPEIAQAMVRGDGDAILEALIVPAGPEVDIENAVGRVNGRLPEYARIGSCRLVPPFTPASGLLTGNGRLRRTAINRAHPKEEAAVKFFDRLISETKGNQARFAMTPQLLAGLTGQISRNDYIAYLTEAFHHVRHTVPLMLEARARLAERGDRMLVEALDDYIVEETGHEDWILDDIEAAGGDRDAASGSDPAPATKAMVDHAYATIRKGNPAAFFGMVFVLEGTSVAMASHGASAVQRRLGLPNTAFRYLNSHGALDQEHMKFFESLMNRIEDPSDQSAIVEMAKDMFRLFGGMFAAIEIEGVRDAA